MTIAARSITAAIFDVFRHPAALVLTFGSIAAVALGGSLSSAGDESAVPAEANPAVARLQAYAAELSAGQPRAHASAPDDEAGPHLPDVATMTARLEARLAGAPDDADGWRLLGFAQAHLGNPDAAVMAFDRALRLRPGDAELTKARDRAAQAR